MARKQQFAGRIDGPSGAVFRALVATLEFRRWGGAAGHVSGLPPEKGQRYRASAGSVVRTGRVVGVIRPVSVTLKETLNDPPCAVTLTMRWRIEPMLADCVVLLTVEYGFNRAAALRPHHWHQRLRQHFLRQFAFLERHLDTLREAERYANDRKNVI